MKVENIKLKKEKIKTEDDATRPTKNAKSAQIKKGTKEGRPKTVKPNRAKEEERVEEMLKDIQRIRNELQDAEPAFREAIRERLREEERRLLEKGGGLPGNNNELDHKLLEMMGIGVKFDPALLSGRDRRRKKKDDESIPSWITGSD